MKFYLLIFFAFFVLLTMILPKWRLKKITGQEPFVVPNDGSVQGFIGKIFRVLTFLVLVVLAIHSFFPYFEKYLLPADFLKIKAIKYSGYFFLHLSVFIICLAQYQMGQSWRIGFDETEKTPLVQKGLFQYSRNPIFLGMLLTMFGLFLVSPNALTLLILTLTYVVLELQARLEENYLLKKNGETYKTYLKKVRRWI